MEILSREVQKEEDNFIITKTTRQTYSKDRIIHELYNIKIQQQNIINQSRQLKSQYDELEENRIEMETWLEANQDEFEGIEGD